MIFHIRGFDKDQDVLHFILFDQSMFKVIVFDEFYKDKIKDKIVSDEFSYDFAENRIEENDNYKITLYPFKDPVPRMWMNNIKIM